MDRSIVKDMEAGGMVRCPQCGYKNSPLYHYCGECGAVLPKASEEQAQPAAARPAQDDAAALPRTGEAWAPAPRSAPRPEFSSRPTQPEEEYRPLQTRMDTQRPAPPESHEEFRRAPELTREPRPRSAARN